MHQYLLFTDLHNIETTDMDLWICGGVMKKSDRYRVDLHTDATVDQGILLDRHKKTEIHSKATMAMLEVGALEEKIPADGENND